MATYTQDQLEEYFKHINFPPSAHPPASDGPLALLTALQTRQIGRVPFEAISLHYSKERKLYLDPDDLFEKIVRGGRGGYCMELNTFFGAVLRSMGFYVMATGGRVFAPYGWTGIAHMVNLVTIDGQRYLVDVGFGAFETTHAIPLISGVEFDRVAPARGRLRYTALPHHTDASQRVWLYEGHEGDGQWKPQIHFLESEFFPSDFEVMNLSPMTDPTSFFVKNVVAMRFILDEEGAKVVGLFTLFNNIAKKRLAGENEVVTELKSEEERVQLLERWFHITLSQRDRKAINGLPSQVVPPK